MTQIHFLDSYNTDNIDLLKFYITKNQWKKYTAIIISPTFRITHSIFEQLVKKQENFEFNYFSITKDVDTVRMRYCECTFQFVSISKEEPSRLKADELFIFDSNKINIDILKTILLGCAEICK